MWRYLFLFNVLLLVDSGLQGKSADHPDSLYKWSVQLLNSDIDSAESLATRLVTESVRSENYLLAGKAAFVIGSIYDDKNMWLNATMRYFEALEYLRRSDVADPVTQVSILKNLGRISNLAGRITDAIRYYEKALSLTATSRAKAGIIFNMGYAYYSQRNYQEAIFRLLDAYQMSVESKNYVRAVNCLNYIGLSFHESGDYVSSREYFNKILNTEQFLDAEYYRKAAAWATHNIGNSWFEQGEHGKAPDSYLASLELKQSLADSSEQFITLMDIGELSLYTGDTATSIEYLERAVDLYPSKAVVPSTFKVFDMLEQAYSSTNSAKQRYYLNRLKHEWRLYDENQRVLKERNLGHEIDRLRREIEERVEKIERQHLYQKVAIWGVIVLTIVIMGGMWLRGWIKNRNKQQLRNEILKTFEPLI